MNSRQKEVIEQLLNNEKKLIKELRKSYTQALTDVKRRIKVLQADEMTQSKIYRLEYQKALEKQISGIIDVLNGENVQAISEHLIKAYEDGYIGTLYSLQGQGVPLLFPINQTELINSVYKKIENMTFANRMNTNMNEFKKIVKSEISRGIANSSTYAEIAKQLTLKTKESFNRAYRIAQTESGRVSSEAKYDSICRAKENGANVVKQWSSTLDMKTRPEHVALDGQIREINEPFELQGLKAMHPHGFGVASMDINCRCVMLERARWAVENEKEFTKMATNKETGEAELLTFDVDSYKAFKKQYWDKYEI